MKYKVGDKVRIRSDLEVNKFYGRCQFNTHMKQFTGKIVTINEVDKNGYLIEEEYNPDGCTMRTYTDEMIERKVEDMEKKEYKGWELLKEIADGNVKENTKIKQKDMVSNYEYDLIYNGNCIIEDDEVTDSGDLLDKDYIFEIVDESEEINIQDIEELKEPLKDSTLIEAIEMIAENRSVINTLIKAVKQLDKKENK